MATKKDERREKKGRSKILSLLVSLATSEEVESIDQEKKLFEIFIELWADDQDVAMFSMIVIKNEREVNLIYFPSQSFFRPCLITSSF